MGPITSKAAIPKVKKSMVQAKWVLPVTNLSRTLTVQSHATQTVTSFIQMKLKMDYNLVLTKSQHAMVSVQISLQHADQNIFVTRRTE